jgi:hypothetical protein
VNGIGGEVVGSCRVRCISGEVGQGWCGDGWRGGVCVVNGFECVAEGGHCFA